MPHGGVVAMPWFISIASSMAAFAFSRISSANEASSGIVWVVKMVFSTCVII